ncbi:MAG TPA: patatin-like phospholipase family protein [Polyangiaceae bacterium]|jgi:hypothetical protein
MRTLAVLGVAPMLACGTFRVDTRSLFAELTYAGTSPPPPANMDVQVLANLELEAMVAYRDPVKMAACLRSFTAPFIEQTGETLAKAGTHWAREAARIIPVEKDCRAADEEALVRYVVARIATAASYLAHSVSISEGQRRALVYEHVPKALDSLAAILERTPPRSAIAQDAPALALSGGSSNGAFTAGFLFELFSLRERALPPEGDGGKYRISALVGTSVGSLIAQIADLYFVDPSRPIDQAKQAALDACNAYWSHKPAATCTEAVDAVTSTRTDCFGGWPPAIGALDMDTQLSGLDASTRAGLAARRPRQMCMLTELYRSFTDVDEQTLMCVESGPVTTALGLLGRRTENLMRFDPLFTNVVGSVLDAYADDMTTNDATRVVVSVETQQNQILGLDERVCAGLPPGPAAGGLPETVGGREYCLGGGVMASAVLPFFARPVRHAYGGVTPNGLCGTWFDGGLRSGFPAFRALQMTRPAMEPFVADPSVRLRVLAISTGRIEGEPSPRPSNIVDIAFNAINQMAGQNMLDEVTQAQQMALIREDELYEIEHGKKREPLPALGPGGSIDEDASVSTVFVPADVPDQIIAGGDYSFDRYIMRGLWVWGRAVALSRVFGQAGPPATPGLFKRLGWGDLEPKALDFAKKDQATMKAWLDAYSLPECPDHADARMAAGQDRINRCVAACPPVVAGGKDFPQYLLCPSGAAGQ